MHPLLKTALFVGAFFLLLAIGGIASVFVRFPQVSPAPDITVQATAEQLERGRYLATHVSLCLDCHSQRDFSLFSGPVVEGTWGMGGERFDQSMGLPGVLHASNITPAALASWSDVEILRAFTAGVSRDGRALFPLMPYPNYSIMARSDAESIVAYLRSLAPIQHDVPPSVLDFPLNIIVRTMPQDAHPQPRPEPCDELAYGAYMTTIAACGACHTPLAAGQPDPERAFAGGHEYPLPGGVVRSANITPHADTGIGGWTREQFIERFKSMQDVRQPAAPGSFNTVMPWTQYAGMTREDLGAIFDYLQSVPPVRNNVVRFEPN